MVQIIKRFAKKHVDIFRFLGPGLLITVGFIDPGNWATNLAGGSSFGFSLLWVITLSTIMLVVVQHNVAHLGIVTGRCLAESITLFTPKWVQYSTNGSAVVAGISTALAELLGGAIALQMLFGIPLAYGGMIVGTTAMVMIWTNSYRRLEKAIIGFVSIIGFSFVFELSLIDVPWTEVTRSAFVPTLPEGSILVVMGIVGAVIMPHNLYLHSEVIQSRQWNLEDEKVINRQLKYEFLDTLFSMVIGGVINMAIIILAASLFFGSGEEVTDLSQAHVMLEPLLGPGAATVFAIALLFSGFSSSITAGMAGGTVVAGMNGESYDVKSPRTRMGIIMTLAVAMVILFFVTDPLKALIYSQVLLCIQLPFTIFTQIWLTSREDVMGYHRNSRFLNILLLSLGALILLLTVALFIY